jgi:histone deacetylase complex regulatory component SIN3
MGLGSDQDAIHYVSRVKHRFIKQREVYDEFISIITSYQQQER